MDSRKVKGTIALDIDGTLTTEMRTIPPRVVDYLSLLAREGWRLIFITGRPFASGAKTLQPLTFPYYLAVQNGAIILEMPARKIILKRYLDRTIFKAMDEICQGEPSDFVVYGGFEHQDVCYYRPKRFSSSLLAYLEGRIKEFKEVWLPVDSYDDMELSEFPSIKCFGHYASAQELTRRIEERLGLHVPLIRDPYDESYYVVQATHPNISKGFALKNFIAFAGASGKVIAAGDDYNDRSMLSQADIRIVMATAPKDLLVEADIIAPPASEEGIISGLKAVFKRDYE
jgi:hydroxymethylpyrimidine pyrophosphatase-like HAD family hydrolase